MSLYIQHLFHFGQAFYCLLVQFPLGPRAHHVVFGIPYLIIGVAVDVIREETHRLHVREQCCRIRQVLFLYRQQK